MPRSRFGDVPGRVQQDQRFHGVPVTGPAAPHHRRLARTVLYLVVLSVLASGATVVAVRRANRPAAPTWPVEADQDGSSSCTDPIAGRQWRVSWSTGADLGVRVRALAARDLPDGAWQDRGAEDWQLRWDQASAERAGDDFAWDHSLDAPLAGLSAVAVGAALSPRLVTPDGACTVYTAAFGPGAAGPGSVAVVGDSLVAQLVPGPVAEADRTGGSGAEVRDPQPGAGPLRTALTGAGYRTQIDGQGGRRWVGVQDSAPLEQADLTMLDELRGLREAGTVVVALGTNDASWTASAPDQAGFEGRLSWTLTHLRQILTELAGQGHCTVLVTAAVRGKVLEGGLAGDRFEPAATRINDLLRTSAAEAPRLALYDWGAQADQHAAGTEQSWFGPDTIHLSPDGVAAYTRALTEAADLGCA